MGFRRLGRGHRRGIRGGDLHGGCDGVERRGVIETIVAAVAGAIAGFLGSWMPYQYNTQKLLRNELDGLKGELSTFQAEADSQHVKDITPPAAPAITWRGYRSIHDPDF